MSNKPFDREVINQLERPLSSDVNMVQGYAQQALVEALLRMYSGTQLIGGTGALGTSQGQVLPTVGNAAFIGSGFRPRSVGAMQVSLEAGLGFFNDNTPATSVGGISGVNDQEVLKPLVLSANELINVPAADPSNPRIDLIEVKLGRAFTDATTRDVFNPSAAAFQPSTVNKTLTYALNGTSTINGAGAINYKTGTPAGSPTGPAVDAGYAVVGYVFVPASAATLGATSMIDSRKLFVPSGILKAALTVQAGVTTTRPVGFMNSLSVQPGVDATVVPGGVSTATVTMLMLAGDASFSQYRSTAVVAGVLGPTGVAYGAQPTVTTNYKLTSADVLAMATANPPVLAAVNQPAVRVDFLLSAAGGANVMQNFPVDLSLGY